MKEKCQVSTYWQRKAAVCLVIFAFWAAKCEAQLGTPPIIVVQPLGISVQNGGTASLSVTAVSTTPMEFNWYFRGVKINNPPVANIVVPLVGTISTLTISNVTSNSAGAYYVKVENGVGEVTSANATLIVLPIPSVALNFVATTLGMTQDGFNLQLSGPSGSKFVIEASTDLKNWTPISTNAAPAGTVSYTDTAATNYPARFYRARLQ